MLQAYATNLKTFYLKHERWAPLSFFAAGFLFDIVTLGRIDDLWGQIQQTLYLLLVGLILVLSFKDFQPTHPTLIKIWNFKDEGLSFLLGSLLSFYTIFYFKASSTISSFLFLFVLCLLIYINEARAFWKWSRFIPMILYIICLISYSLCLVPILVGGIGPWIFIASLLMSALFFMPVIYFLRSTLAPMQTGKILASTLAIFALLYFTSVIPPVPLALNDLAIYRDLKKEDGHYHFSYTRSPWKFWQKGDQHFLARPGDKIYLYVNVFSPGGLNEKLFVRWELRGKFNWEPQDLIPIEISGGRSEGFRGFTIKQNYSPGDWRVMIETQDKRELGRLNFTVELDSETSPREFRTHVE